MRLISGWIAQQEDAQSAISEVTARIRAQAEGTIDGNELKSLAQALNALVAAGEAGVKAHQSYVYGPERKAQIDARSVTINTVWQGIHEERARAVLRGSTPQLPPALPLPPGIISTPAPAPAPYADTPHAQHPGFALDSDSPLSDSNRAL